MQRFVNHLLKLIKRIKPSQTLVIGFLLVILTGTILLSLPFATTSPGKLSLLDSLFSSTSAVCVTGLIVENTGQVFTVFGQIVIITLIQIGGLGFMTMASLFFIMLGKRISLRERLVIQEAYNLDSIHGVVRLVRNAVIITFTTEAVGAVFFAIRMIPKFGLGKGIYHSVFLAISSFCNAGFDALGNYSSLREYVSDPIVNITVMLLITLGGIGFPVFIDFIHKRSFKRMMLHSKLVLIMSGTLFITGAILTAMFEWNNPKTIGELNAPTKIMASCFQSVTLRTAGFETIPQNNLTPAGSLIGIIYMFIGASPASTGGGIKTTTFFIVILSLVSMVRGKQDTNIFRRRISDQIIRKATTILSIALCLVLVDTVVISAVENMTGGNETLGQILFEVVSAFGTVGLSTGITSGLNWISKILIIITMFAGRLGPFTLSMAISGATPKQDTLHYPEERLIIG